MKNLIAAIFREMEPWLLAGAFHSLLYIGASMLTENPPHFGYLLAYLVASGTLFAAFWGPKIIR